MKIKFIKSAVSLGFGYAEGEEADMEDSLAKQLVSDKYAVIVKPAPQSNRKKKK